MFIKSLIKAITLSVLFISNLALSAQIPLLNHNFDSDAISTTASVNYFISGWVDSGEGVIGVWAPAGNGTYYDEMGNRGQIAFLANGGRFSQTVNANLILGETYTISFDAGHPKTHNYPNFVVRVKAKGLVIAQEQSSNFSLLLGKWKTESLTFTATENMPIGEPIVVEFSNLSRVARSEIDIDNVTLTTAGTGTTAPGTNLGPLTMIMEDTTLLVPDQYPNINVALRYLDDKQIKVGKTVKIQVTDCSNQVYTESVNVAHPNGDAIHIIGNGDNPELCTLQFNGVSGFLADNASRIGLVDGFSVIGTQHQDIRGFAALNGSSINLGPNLMVSNFEDGVFSSSNSTINADYVKSSFNLSAGFKSTNNASINANFAMATGNELGFRAQYSGFIQATESKALNNITFGFTAVSGGVIEAKAQPRPAATTDSEHGEIPLFTLLSLNHTAIVLEIT